VNIVKIQKAYPTQPHPLAHGGVLRNTRRGRSSGRALAVRHTMHVVLRSTKAKGKWSFTYRHHRQLVSRIITKHAAKNKISLLAMANVGNHIHLHLQLPFRRAYFPFIRAISGAIALSIMRASKNSRRVFGHAGRFWDHRPYSVVITKMTHFLRMKDYMRVNTLEGQGYTRIGARLLLSQEDDGVDWNPPGPRGNPHLFDDG
jgi:REP element-mobilizing transposase RayT